MRLELCFERRQVESEPPQVMLLGLDDHDWLVAAKKLSAPSQNRDLSAFSVNHKQPYGSLGREERVERNAVNSDASVAAESAIGTDVTAAGFPLGARDKGHVARCIGHGCVDDLNLGQPGATHCPTELITVRR